MPKRQKFPPVPLGNGKFCYSGPSCQQHGFLHELRAKILGLTLKNLEPAYTPKLFNLPDACFSVNQVITGKNQDLENSKSMELQQLDEESRHFQFTMPLGNGKFCYSGPTCQQHSHQCIHRVGCRPISDQVMRPAQTMKKQMQRVF